MPIVKTDVYDVQAPFALDLRLVKADMNARNAIGTFQRYVGMVVCVLNDYTFWQLRGGTSNDDWVQVFLPTYTLLAISSDTTINWTTDVAPDESGGASGQTYAQRFGNVPNIQVWMDTGSGYSLEVVPITMTFSGANIDTVTIQVGSSNSRVIIK